MRHNWTRSAACVAALVSLTVWTGSAAAQAENEGARPMGMASSFIANASGSGAIYHNPAGVAAATMYAIDGAYRYSPNINTFSASVVDSMINPKLSAGLSYGYETSNDSDLPLTGHDGRMALASQIIPRQLILGVGGRYLNYESDGDEVLNGFTLDAGTLLRVSDAVSLGLAANNLVPVCNDDTCLKGIAPRLVGGGLALGSAQSFQASTDVRANVSDGEDMSWIFAGGGEFLLANVLAVRAGYQHRTQGSENIMAGGVGFRSQAIGLDLGYKYNLQTKESRAALSVQVYMMN